MRRSHTRASIAIVMAWGSAPLAMPGSRSSQCLQRVWAISGLVGPPRTGPAKDRRLSRVRPGAGGLLLPGTRWQAWSLDRPRPVGRTAECCGRAGLRCAVQLDGAGWIKDRVGEAALGRWVGHVSQRRRGGQACAGRAQGGGQGGFRRGQVGGQGAIGLRGDPGQERGRLLGVTGPFGVGKLGRLAPQQSLQSRPRRPAGPGT